MYKQALEAQCDSYFRNEIEEGIKLVSCIKSSDNRLWVKLRANCWDFERDLLWGAVCVKMHILANIYGTHRRLLNITTLIRYLVNINPPVSNFHAMFSKHRLEMHGCDVLANITSKCTDAMFSKHRLEIHRCDV